MFTRNIINTTLRIMYVEMGLCVKDKRDDHDQTQDVYVLKVIYYKTY